jgi:hypothetical protein
VRNLFSWVSDKEIGTVVTDVLSQYTRDHDLRTAVLSLIQFADRHELGAWKRTRFAAEISTYAYRRGMCSQAAMAFGDGFGACIDHRVDCHSLNWKAYGAGMEGAVRFREGWTEHSCHSVGDALVDDYILNPADRTSLLHAYQMGWMACDNGRVVDDAVATLKRTCASIANPDLVDSTQLHASRNGEITEAAVNAYRLRRAAEALPNQA